MHPYGKLHNPLRLLAVLFTLMIVESIDCNENLDQCMKGLRSLRLFAKDTAFVRTQGRHVILSDDSTDMHKFDLQQITIDGTKFLLFSPTSNRFICWNRNYTRLVAMHKLSSKDIPCYCKFKECSFANAYIELMSETCDKDGKLSNNSNLRTDSRTLTNFTLPQCNAMEETSVVHFHRNNRRIFGIKRQERTNHTTRHKKNLESAFLKLSIGDSGKVHNCKQQFRNFCRKMRKWEGRGTGTLPNEIKDICKRYSRKHTHKGNIVQKFAVTS